MSSIQVQSAKAAWAARGMLALCMAGLSCLAGLMVPGSASAQTAPTIRLGNAPAVLEGNVGTRTLRFPITLSAATSQQVSGRFITRPSSLSSSALAGTACTGLTDYLTVDQSFTIAPNTLGTTVNVTVCSDTRIEPAREIVYTALTGVFGAACPSTGCVASGAIVEDDIAGSISIDNVSVSRSTLFSLERSVPIRLSFPYGEPVTVEFSTLNGTASGGVSCPLVLSSTGSDYQSTRGTATFLPGETTATLKVPVCRSSSLVEETFTVVLNNASAPATIFRNRATVTLLPASGGTKVGVFGLSPDDARVQVDEPTRFVLEWVMPEGSVWRDLDNIGLRVRGEHKTLLWVNWNESSDLFSLCQRSGVRIGAYQFYGPGGEADLDEDEDAERETLAVSCSAGALPGSDVVLESRHARLHLAGTQVVGSGPTGASVMLNLSISFKASARGRAQIELAASDDTGQVDDFVRATRLQVLRPRDER